MESFAVYFKPRGSLASTISSDTLFGAICWGIQTLRLVDDVGTWLINQAMPPFAFSSLFPVWFDSNKKALIRCYPRPETFTLSISKGQQVVNNYQQLNKCSLKEAQQKVSEFAKPFGRIKYVSEKVFSDIIQGNLTPSNLLENLLVKNSEFELEAGILIKKCEYEQMTRNGLIQQQPSYVPVQHNHIDRLTGTTVEGMLFYQNEMFFQEGAGLWAFLRADRTMLDTYIRPALRYLSDTGLGANRTSGKGHFFISFEPLTSLPDVSNTNGTLMLSRYLPGKNEPLSTDKQPLAYRMETLRPKREQRIPVDIQNRITPPIYKRAIRIFEPGSVFPLTQKKEIYGRWAELVTPEEGSLVLQSGLSVSVFLRVEEDQDEK